MLVLGITLLASLSILGVATRIILVRSFTQVEASHLRKDVGRALNTISNELSSMSSTADDWASWDETYAFAQSGSPLLLSP